MRKEKDPAALPPLFRYGSAIAATMLAVAMRLALTPVVGDRIPYATFYLAVLFSAWYGGLGPALVTIVLAALAEDYFFIPPLHTLIIHGTEQWVGFALYSAVSLTAVLLIEAQRRAQIRAENNAEELRKQEKATAQLAAIVESSADAIIGKTLDGVLQTWNRGAERIYGYAAAEAIGRPVSILVPPDRAQEEEDIQRRVGAGERIEDFETVRLRKDGTPIDVSLTISPIRDRTGKIIGTSHIARDITERKRLEERMRQVQKLESLGVLAGGVAHDFNNLLTAILGNASLALEDLPRESSAHATIQQVVGACEQAAKLTSQMLAYSGRGKFLIRPVELSAFLRKIVGFVQSSISRTVEVRLELAHELPVIEADEAQIQQLVMNLVINGAEAIGENPGTVTIRAGIQEVHEEDLRKGLAGGDLGPGEYVFLEVQDTGCGMDESIQARIFEPFFTTKFTGRGLGMAAALGIVRGHKGAIQIDSQPGRGSTFRVLFPAMEGTGIVAGTERERELETPAGHGVVLIVDDEPIVRSTAKAMLEKYGYTVLLARNGREAVSIFRERAGEVRVVLLDLTMPVMSGEETLRRLRTIRPDVSVLLSSGFSETEAVRKFEGLGLAGFLQKPYTATRLVAKVKAALPERAYRASGD